MYDFVRRLKLNGPVEEIVCRNEKELSPSFIIKGKIKVI